MLSFPLLHQAAARYLQAVSNIMHTNSQINTRAENQWNNSNETLKFHYNYLENKKVFELDFIDLVLVSNFKGGNSTIRYENETEKKLKKYSEYFQLLDKKFSKKKLSEIIDLEFQELKKIISDVVSLCYNNEYEIKGFKASYLSALLNIYFPNLIPILDRRILINLDLVDNNNLSKDGQIINIQNYYSLLLDKMRELSQKTTKSLREIDKEIFIKELPDWTKK